MKFVHAKTKENFGDRISSEARSAVDSTGARRSVASLAAAPRRWAESITEEQRMKTVTRFFKDESGVTAIEYGLIAALISVVAITAMTFAGTQLIAVYDKIGNSLASAL
jgi:pilus assembly protein Flp/PilA